MSVLEDFFEGRVGGMNAYMQARQEYYDLRKKYVSSLEARGELVTMNISLGLENINILVENAELETRLEKLRAEYNEMSNAFMDKITSLMERIQELKQTP